MIHTKLYLYESGEDLSRFILQGDQKSDDLTDVLDVVNLTLVGLDRAEEFAPTTKFVYEKWFDVYDEQGNATQQLWKSWDIMVTEDMVTKPILSDDNYYNHQITFNEASVVAQGRIVDNISTTYKLKDITLNTTIYVDDEKESDIVVKDLKPTIKSYIDNLALWGKLVFARQFVWRFPDWFDGAMAQWNSAESDWANIPYFVGVNTDGGAEGITSLTIPIPMLEIKKCVENTNTFLHEGFCTIRVIVEKENFLTGAKEYLNNDGTWSTKQNNNKLIIINPLDESVSATEGAWSFETFPYKILSPKGEILTHMDFKALALNIAPSDEAYFKSVVSSYDITPNPLRKITLSLNDGLEANCNYTIKVVLYGKDNDNTTPQYQNPHSIVANVIVGGKKEYYASCDSEQKLFWSNNIKTKVTNNNLYAQLQFVTYDANHNKEIFTAEAPPQSAYELFVRSQLCSQNINKINGVPITDLSNLPFFVGSDDEELLKSTQVIENFYERKNLWEIFLEIGKYIHAIPRIHFADNGRFLVTFDRLGRVEQFENTSMPLSIYNSRNIENYISSCSSYVANFVQLGGVIDEWVAPKSSSDEYLVYNDVAEIITSKPIIEIVDMEVKCIHPTRYGATNYNKVFSLIEGNGYVFEENVYQLFGVDANQQLNKGLAIYYKLGTNKIVGLNYQLPTISAGDPRSDYAIKRILRELLYGTPNGIDPIFINDFIFHIVYHTKDDARTDQSRPDLRKYLLNSDLDKVPQHYQFNNQQDILIDSVKFGDNIYGKLIRTGNTEYKVTEWHQEITQCKNIGDLYNIYGNLYYVAKVENTFFCDHVVSVVTYSKDYNQLSEIIGIPSEPRFYEISEQSLINRDVSINAFLLLTTEQPDEYLTDLSQITGLTYLKDLLFTSGVHYPKYAITTFKNDGNRAYGSVYGNELYLKDICSITNTYSVRNTLTIEWDMVDNFSAGDKSVDKQLDNQWSQDKAYRSLEPVRYGDVYGRADLFDYYILRDLALDTQDVFNLPESPLSSMLLDGFFLKRTNTSIDITSQELDDIVLTEKGREALVGDIVVVEYDGLNEYQLCEFKEVGGVDQWVISQRSNSFPTYTTNALYSQRSNILFSNTMNDQRVMGSNYHGLALMKDNREKLGFNFNVQMLTDSDRFVLSGYLWQQEKDNLVIALLSEEINKFSNETLPESTIVATYTLNAVVPLIDFPYIYVDISTPLANVDLTGIKAIAIVNDTITTNGQKPFVFGRNISDLEENEAKKDWYICGITKDLFKKE